MRYYLAGLRHYATFAGRARPAEFWWFQLFNLVVVPWVLLVLEGIADQVTDRPWPSPSYSIPVFLYRVATLIPAIAVGVRRMHDTNHRGWWLLFPVANLAFAVTEGTKGDNRFGAEPKRKSIPAL